MHNGASMETGESEFSSQQGVWDIVRGLTPRA